MTFRVVVTNINFSVAILFVIVLANVPETIHGEECVHIVNMSQPYFYSRNYAEVMRKECILKLEARPGERINLVFLNFELDSQKNCDSQYVTLYDGYSTSDTLLGKFCGDNPPHPIISTKHILLLRFRSFIYKHFRFHQSTGCNHIIKAAKGLVSSPNYPVSYEPHLLCAWEFEAPFGHWKLEVKDFVLEEHGSCIYDYVEIYDVNYKSNGLLGRFCGTNIPHTIKSRSRRMLVIFRSDTSNQYKGFTAKYTLEFPALGLNETERSEFERNLTQHLLNTRKCHRNVLNKWGTDITRTAVALYLTDEQFFASRNEKGEEIAYELILQLKSKLVTKKRISTNDLALFVNAMTVACIKSENFYGVNITNELLKRIDNSNLTNPFVMLTLCNAGINMEMAYVYKLKEIFETNVRSSWTDTQAMVVMALKCISKRLNLNLNDTLTDMVTELKRKQEDNGMVDNLENTALVIQALMATHETKIFTNFSLSGAMKAIIKDVMQSDVDNEEVYYILPILKYRTLTDINSDHCENFYETELDGIRSLRKQPEERIPVQITIIIGDDKDFSSTRKIKVPSNYSFYQAIEKISVSEPDYRVRYKIVEGKPYVSGFGKFKDSTADGMFWFIYTRPLNSTFDTTLVKESPADIEVNEADELILWYKSGI